MKRRRETGSFLVIPIYGGKLHLIIATDVQKARAAREYLFGPAPEALTACCSYTLGGTYGLFFAFDSIDHEVIAHEAWHLTDRVMEWARVKDREAAAHFCGWITNWVYAELRRLKVKLV